MLMLARSMLLLLWNTLVHLICMSGIDSDAGLAGRSKDGHATFDSLSDGFNAQLPTFVLAMMPFVLTAR